MSGARLLLSPSPNGILQRVNLFSSCIYSLRAQWHVSDRQRLFTHRGNVSSFRRGPIRRMNSELAPLAPACWDDECAFKRLTQHAADCRSLYCPLQTLLSSSSIPRTGQIIVPCNRHTASADPLIAMYPQRSQCHLRTMLEAVSATRSSRSAALDLLITMKGCYVASVALHIDVLSNGRLSTSKAHCLRGGIALSTISLPSPCTLR